MRPAREATAKRAPRRRMRRASDDGSTWPRPAPRRGRLAVSVRWRRAPVKRACPGRRATKATTVRKTKKEERDSGFGARSQTTPIGPLLLDGVAIGRGSPDRPRRKRVGLTGSRPAQRPKSNASAADRSRRSEQRQLLWHRTRPRKHLRAMDDGERHRSRSHRARLRDQRCGGGGRGQHGNSSRLAQDQSVAPGAQSGRRTTCSTAAASSSSRQPLARAATAWRGSVAADRRSSDDAPPWQRGAAVRREGAETRTGRGDMAGFRCARR